MKAWEESLNDVLDRVCFLFFAEYAYFAKAHPVCLFHCMKQWCYQWFLSLVSSTNSSAILERKRAPVKLIYRNIKFYSPSVNYCGLWELQHIHTTIHPLYCWLCGVSDKPSDGLQGERISYNQHYTTTLNWRESEIVEFSRQWTCFRKTSL